jgi:hypothetical protein
MRAIGFFPSISTGRHSFTNGYSPSLSLKPHSTKQTLTPGWRRSTGQLKESAARRRRKSLTSRRPCARVALKHTRTHTVRAPPHGRTGRIVTIGEGA